MSNWKGQKEWDKANLKMVATQIKKSEAEMFEDYANMYHTTRSKILSDYIRHCIMTHEPPITYDK